MVQIGLDSVQAESHSDMAGRAGLVLVEEPPMRYANPKALLIIVACICFAIAALISAGTISLDSKINWPDVGLFFGFLAFIF